MKKVLFGLLWFVVLSIAGILLMGVVIGLLHRGESEAVVRAAATPIAAQLTPILIVVCALLAALGSYFGFLPGTRTKKPEASTGSEQR